MPLTSNGILCGAVDNDFLYVGGGDGKVKKVALAGGSWTLTHEAQLDSRVMSVNLSNDGAELIVGTEGGKMYRVLTNDLSYLLHSDAHAGRIRDVSFGADSNTFATVDELGALKTWDLSEYKPLYTGYPQKATTALSCFNSRNDDTILVGYGDGSLRCFESVNQKAQVWEISKAHRGGITAIYDNGQYLLTGGEDGAVRVWSRQTHALLIQFNDQKKDIVSLFPDCQQPNVIHSASTDRTICSYDLKKE